MVIGPYPAWGLKDARKRVEKAKKEAEAKAYLDPVQAEVHKNQSEKLIVAQEMIEVENRINFLVNRFPQPVERTSAGFFDLAILSRLFPIYYYRRLNNFDFSAGKNKFKIKFNNSDGTPCPFLNSLINKGELDPDKEWTKKQISNVLRDNKLMSNTFSKCFVHMLSYPNKYVFFPGIQFFPFIKRVAPLIPAASAGW